MFEKLEYIKLQESAETIIKTTNTSQLESTLYKATPLTGTCFNIKMIKLDKLS